MYLLNKIVGLLPAKLQPYAKSVIPAVVTVAVLLYSWAQSGELDGEALRDAGQMAVVALLAFLFPNLRK
jgi:hypothetical protein